MWRELDALLQGAKPHAALAAVSPEDRRSMLEILRETQPEFAAVSEARDQELKGLTITN